MTGWFKKAAEYLAGLPGGRFAFVSTNSITQGQPVPALFAPLFEAGWRIRFAHQPFAWTSEAPGSAAVHCVIIGFDREPREWALLFSYATPKGEAIPGRVRQVNGYLLDGPNVFVRKRMRPLATQLEQCMQGSKPAEGGHLLIDTREAYERVAADPVAAKYLRRFVGAKELIRGRDRWCLWLVDLDPADISKSTLLRDRLEQVRAFREASRKRSTVEHAATPHLFVERRQPAVSYVCVPSVVSETRRFFTVTRLDAEVIASNLVFMCADVDGFAFAVLSSSMFVTWQKTVGGRLESRLRFSNTVVWNNLPLPPVDEALRQQIIQAGQGVLAARALHPERSLAEHYHPLAMEPQLLAAHAALDRVVDRAFGAEKPLRDNEQRLRLLFTRYTELSTTPLNSAKS